MTILSKLFQGYQFFGLLTLVKNSMKYLCNPSNHNRKYKEYTHEMCAPKINYEALKSIPAIHPTITDNTENILVKRTPHILIHESHNVSISVMANSFHNIISKAKHSSIFMSHTEAILWLLQIVWLWRKEWEIRGTKVAPWCKHCSSCGWWKGTSRDKATLISEEIKSLAPAVLELFLSEGISK